MPSIRNRRAPPALSRTCIALLVAAGLHQPARAQEGAAPPGVAPHRAPSIALVQPPVGGSVPADRPVVVFRFAPGEAADPIDASSFTVLVNGRDRRTLFQVSGGEAWGPIGDPAAKSAEDAVAPGAHQVEARICSARGTCGSVSATVVVRPGAVPVPAAAAPEVPATPRRSRVLEALLAAVKKLIEP
ncbi:MAG: hypothetical protein ACREON_17090 [Gemmatimonadaceae bacterium]